MNVVDRTVYRDFEDIKNDSVRREAVWAVVYFWRKKSIVYHIITLVQDNVTCPFVYYDLRCEIK